ncbi:hypothetical protein EYC84_006980 [Monilinia fructicola]|uniref:RING-type domain-containing protein n=1 Tax=Monilinia fructicola TaxID=38448 RepID=A0A5M9K543_MONFR|nr:hypothetical protein EYC84_006980 [Monilinia fructicola]
MAYQFILCEISLLRARSFIKRLTAFLRYRRATHDMNSRYEDATVEDIQREDTCIICREEMRPWSVTNPPVPAGAQPRPGTVNERTRPKKLPCGHILHLGCLKSWLERQQVCPTCRNPVVETPQDAQANANRNARANQTRSRSTRWTCWCSTSSSTWSWARKCVCLILDRSDWGLGRQILMIFLAFKTPPGGQVNAAGVGPRVYGLELGIPRRAQPQAQPVLVHNGDHAGPIPLDQLPPTFRRDRTTSSSGNPKFAIEPTATASCPITTRGIVQTENPTEQRHGSFGSKFSLAATAQAPNFHQTPQIPPSFSSRPTKPTRLILLKTNVINTPPSISADQSATIHTLPSSTNTNPFTDPPDLPNWGNSQLFSGSSLAGNQNLDGARSAPTLPPHDGSENLNLISSAEHTERRSDDDGEMRRREKGKAKAATVEDTVDTEE